MMEVEELKAELGGMECLSDTVRGSSDEWPYIQHPITVKGRNAPKEQRIREKIRKLDRQCRNVEEAVERAPNGRIRRMLKLRYVLGLRWAEVAAQMGETEDAVKSLDQSFFKGK